MDQLKVFLRQCVKYRFWIAFGVSLLLPAIGYFVGFSTINAETTKREGEINAASKEIVKYKTPGIVNGQYQPAATAKKEALIQDVDATWRRCFSSQEPLLKWPAPVEERFRKWGRKYPTDVDRNQIQSTIIDYTVAYPEFVEKIYTIFKPFNFDDGSGIVVAADSKALLAPASFSQDAPPDLTKIWAEQERLWVVTALLDAVAKVNESVDAKDWEGAIVKQINALDVGAPTDQDQKSMAKGETLVPADTLADPSSPPPPAAAPAPGAMPAMPDLSGGSKGHDVLYLKTDSQQFKTLPIKLTVLVDQARLSNYLVGLENSPMSIEVNEVEIAKPLTPVAKPAYGERSSFNIGGGAAAMGNQNPDMASNARMRNMAGGMGNRPSGYPGGDMMGGRSNAAFGGGGGAAAPPKGGVNIRGGPNLAEERKAKAKREAEAAAKGKGEVKKIDQYYNVIEVTVYGRARFYLAPPPLPQPAPSTAAAPEPTPPPTPAPSTAPAPDATKAETPAVTPPAAAEPAKKDEAPKPEAAAPKEDAPKAEPAPSKNETPKAEAPKTDAPAPKR